MSIFSICELTPFTLQSSSFTQLGLSVFSNLTWKAQINSIAKHASQKSFIPSRARGCLPSSTINHIQIPDSSFPGVLLSCLG